MRYRSISGVNESRVVESEVKEMLLHEFYMGDNKTYDYSQAINLMNVSYTSKMNKFVGSYGP